MKHFVDSLLFTPYRMTNSNAPPLLGISDYITASSMTFIALNPEVSGGYFIDS